jgi:hypothetical protein
MRPALLFLAALAACDATGSTGREAAELTVDEDSILSALASYRTSPGMAKVNDTPYETALGTGARIDVYVSAHAFAPYAAIAPEATGTGADVPEGTLIVREVQEASGAVKSLTLMYKGPKGYNPDLDDFWFGVTSPDGTPVVENGASKTGKLQECYSCHLARGSDGFLFGVPADNRAGDAPVAEPPEPPPPPSSEPLCGDFFCNGGENCAVCSEDCGQCPDEDDEDDDDGEDDDEEDEDDED